MNVSELRFHHPVTAELHHDYHLASKIISDFDFVLLGIRSEIIKSGIAIKQGKTTFGIELERLKALVKLSWK